MLGSVVLLHLVGKTFRLWLQGNLIVRCILSALMIENLDLGAMLQHTSDVETCLMAVQA